MQSDKCRKKMNSVFYILLVLSICYTTSVKSDYMAAVVEHVPLVDPDSATQTIEDNLNEYRIYLGIAKRSNVDIIVFPEYGLTGVVDDPSNYSVVIPDIGTEEKNISDYTILSLSQAAIEHRMYIVFNILEKAINEKKKTEYYNTNVVFDRSGKIIAKYRKINLYEEDALTPGNIKDIENAVFTTDFGRNFGTFICYDIAFYDPSRKILGLKNKEPVTDIAYPTGWYSIMPFYHSISFHLGYAAENKVNVLAANLNSAKDGQSGSGIYGADGTVYSYYLSGKSSSKVLISAVKTGPNLQKMFLPGLPGFNDLDPNTEDLSNFITQYYFKASDYKFKHVDLSKGNITQRVCDGSFCCDFTLNMTSAAAKSTTATYKLLAYRGPIMLGSQRKGPTKMCYLIACESSNSNTCGTRNVNNTATFTSVSVRTKVRNELEQYYVPVTLRTDLLPVFNSTYQTGINENAEREILLVNTKTQDKILLFGIFSNGVEKLTVSWMLSVLVVFNVFKYFIGNK